ncbi:MAG: PEP-CTERM sorting domain-containing protein [Phycisphaerales bacterium]|jgi:hypothetical protein|nr:PEP-CTERM sorting domain-containing protein [Phycisphaerales bacterium]
MKHTNTTLLALFGLLLVVSGAHAATVYTGNPSTNHDAIWIAGNWDDGMPGVNQNAGTIAIGAELSGANFNSANNVVITHSAGNLGDLNNEFAYVDGKFENSGAGTLTWNMTGGSLSDYRVLTMATGAGSTAKITGGTITGHASGIGDRIQADNGGVVTFGGTAVMDRSYFNAIGTGEINLTGGTHNDANGGFTTSHTGSVINISGSYTLTSWLNDRNHTQVFVSNGTIDFKTGWTGSIADANATNVWDSGTWIDTMTAGDVSVDGEDITADNFSTYFNVDENGTLTMVPEPATMSLLALGGMAMLKRRKRA